MAAETALTYRLQGIPRACDRNDVQDLVSRLLGVDRSKVLVRSLAQHPLKDDSKIATLSLLEKPAVIASKQKTSAWLFREPDQNVAGGFVDFTLDTHFHGFTPLHHLEDEQCNTDLIALSGLNGHAFGSFKAKGLDFMWIRDSLPADFPSCRLFIYGYDTNMIHSASHQSILDLGSQLASSLRGLVLATTKTFRSDRSLILLGHSLGGLVVEQAIVELSAHAWSPCTDNEHIIQSVKGILLFGVPQKGMSVEALITMVKEQPNEDLITSLKEDSAFLQLQQENFRKARLNMKNTSVVAFFETQETPTVQNVSGKWQTMGPLKLLVKKTSATSMSDVSVAINRNHSEIVKFQPNDADYDRVLSELQRLRKRNHEQQRNVEVEPPTNKEIEALQSLGFPEQHWRRDGICPGEDTCEWLTGNPTFRSWFHNPEDPELRRLWIRGHPGSGKSTLMKHAWEYLNRHLPAFVTIASFFFHARGVPLQRSRMGFLRSVLHQLSFRLPSVRSDFMRFYDEKRTVAFHLQWSEDELQELIRNALTSRTESICIVVDALDEAGKQTAEDLVKWFGRLTRLPNVRIIFSCRYYPVLPTISKFAISMEAENAEDIDRVVRTELRSEFDENEAQILENDIIQNANGMFQWATLVTNSVLETYRETGQSVGALHDMIKHIPRTLHALYDSLLSTIKESEKNQAIKLLSWILFAAKPLNSHELQHALVVDANTTARFVSDFPPFVDVERAVKTLSRGLAEVKTHTSSQTPQFIHQSVVDYLKEDGLAKLVGLGGRNEAFAHAHFQLSRSCIRYLLMEDFLDALKGHENGLRITRSMSFNGTSPMAEEFPLASYACNFWFHHTIYVEQYGYDQHDLLDILPWIREATVPFQFTLAWCKLFFRTADDGFYSSRVMYSRESDQKLLNPRKFGITSHMLGFNHLQSLMWEKTMLLEDQIPFNLFALAGIRCVLKRLLEEADEDNNARTGGNVTQMLFGPGSPQARTKDAPSPLLCLLIGNPDISLEEIPKRLIRTYVNHRYHITPLFWAVAMKRRDIVHAFVDAGATGNLICNNAVRDQELSVFEIAILVDDMVIMRQLIDAYGKGSGPTANAASALHYAIEYGSDAVIAMLIEQCSKRYTAEEFINFSSGDDPYTPLELALKTDNWSSCRALIDNGADVENAVDGNPLLLYCVDMGSAEAVSLLLESGADPNRGPPASPTPLMTALSRMDKTIVSVLLEDNRTDPNLTDEGGLTALMHMSLSADKGVQEKADVIWVIKCCLSSRKFDLEIKDERGETLLSKVVTTTYPELVEILLTDGQADPNTRDAWGVTPLMKAAFHGHRTTTQLLLSRADIDIDAQDCWGKTALYYAVLNGNMVCAKLLEDHLMADLRASGFFFKTAEHGDGAFLGHLPDLRPVVWPFPDVGDLHSGSK